MFTTFSVKIPWTNFMIFCDKHELLFMIFWKTKNQCLWIIAKKTWTNVHKVCKKLRSNIHNFCQKLWNNVYNFLQEKPWTRLMLFCYKNIKLMFMIFCKKTSTHFHIHFSWFFGKKPWTSVNIFRKKTTLHNC